MLNKEFPLDSWKGLYREFPEFTTSGVYQITCQTENGLRYYIGSSIKLHNRMRQHCSHLKAKTHPNSILQNIYNKYGYDNFTFQIVEFCQQGDTIPREQFWIDTVKPDLNLVPKAGSSVGYKLPDHFLQKQRILFQSTPHRNKRKIGQENPVYKIDVNTHQVIAIYPSVAEAYRLGCTGGINAAANQSYLTAGGYIWCWVYDKYGNFRDIVEHIQTVTDRKKLQFKHQAKRVLQIDPHTGDIVHEYLTIKEVSIYLETSLYHTRLICVGDILVRGYYWKMIDNPKVMFRGTERQVAKLNPITHEIIEVYPSVSEAARQNQVNNTGIGKICRSKRLDHHLKGYSWKFIEE